jgi:hypothetical protein
MNPKTLRPALRVFIIVALFAVLALAVEAWVGYEGLNTRKSALFWLAVAFFTLATFLVPSALGKKVVCSQSTNLQKDALAAASVDMERDYHEDKCSGSTPNEKRPGLAAVLNKLRPVDVLVVWKLDRLSRSLRDLVNTVHSLEERGVSLRVLTGAPIDTTSPAGKTIFAVFSAPRRVREGPDSGAC